MPRHYTDDEKRLVLDRLIANHGDVIRTANETGVSDRAIYSWRKEPQFAHLISPLLPLSPHVSHNEPSSSPLPEGEGSGVGVSALPPETTEAFQTLHDQMLTLANTLSHRIEEAIDEAPLNQRVAALAQLIDRIAKLASLLPKQEEEIQYIYEYEDEVEHHIEKKEAADENHSRKETQDQAED